MAVELGEALFAPGKMIVFLHGSAFHLAADLAELGREGLALIKRLCRHFAGMIDAH